MADIVKSSTVLAMEAEFADGDTRTLSVADPNTAINLPAQVKNLGTYVKDNQVLVGDKSGAAFTGFRTAYIKRSQTVFLDLTTA